MVTPFTPGERLTVTPAYVFGWSPNGVSQGRIDGEAVTFIRRVPGGRGSRIPVAAVLRSDGRLMYMDARYLTR
jgi:hypothetical protein